MQVVEKIVEVPQTQASNVGFGCRVCLICVHAWKLCVCVSSKDKRTQRNSNALRACNFNFALIPRVPVFTGTFMVVLMLPR